MSSIRGHAQVSVVEEPAPKTNANFGTNLKQEILLEKQPTNHLNLHSYNYTFS